MKTGKITAVIMSITVIFLFALFTLLNINKLIQTPMNSIPLDAGWLGFLIMFANGFFFSFILNRNKIGTTERLMLSIGLGFGLTFAAMILLGLFWQFSLLTVLLSQIILLIILITVAVFRGLRADPDIFSWNKKSSTWLTSLNGVHAILLAIIGILVFIALYNTLSVPPTDWDSLAYGVNYAKIMYNAGNIPLIAGPSIGIEMSASYPPGVQLLGVFLFVFAGKANDFYYRMLSPIFSLSTLLVTYKFAMLLNKERTFSIYAISALSVIPFFWEVFINET